jgi:hypothetical protein
MYFISLVLENLALSIDDNEDILYCLKVHFNFLNAMDTEMILSIEWYLCHWKQFFV